MTRMSLSAGATRSAGRRRVIRRNVAKAPVSRADASDKASDWDRKAGEPMCRYSWANITASIL